VGFKGAASDSSPVVTRAPDAGRGEGRGGRTICGSCIQRKRQWGLRRGATWEIGGGGVMPNSMTEKCEVMCMKTISIGMSRLGDCDTEKGLQKREGRSGGPRCQLLIKFSH